MRRTLKTFRSRSLKLARSLAVLRRRKFPFGRILASLRKVAASGRKPIELFLEPAEYSSSRISIKAVEEVRLVSVIELARTTTEWRIGMFDGKKPFAA